MNLFLDLEETIIESWFDRKLIPNKVEIIKKFIKKEKIKSATIFSFAITNEKELMQFNQDLKPWLEEVLEIEINALNITNVLKEILKNNNIFMNLNDAITELFLLNSKRDMFIEHIRLKSESGIFILFDDTVKDLVIIEDNKRIVLINI